jgi:fatty-acyl-CoA synthase
MERSPFWPVGLSSHIVPSQTSLYLNLESASTRHPDKHAIHYYGASMSYARLLREVDALAGFLQGLCGVRQGDRVALYMQNCPQFIVAFYAILRADAVVVPINPMSLTCELRHIVADSGARIMIFGDELYENAATLLGKELTQAVIGRYADYLPTETDLPLPAILSAASHLREPASPSPRACIVNCSLIGWRDALATHAQPSPHRATSDNLAILLYTSGTTAAPKGCMHAHRNAMHVIAASVQWCGITSKSVVLCALPLFHATGMQQCMNASVLASATMVVMTRWDPRCAAVLIERYRVSMWIAISTMMADFMSLPDLDKFDLSSLTCLAGGGAAMPKALAERIHTYLRVSYMEGYGLSETISATHINPPGRCKRQCLGLPIQDTESMVVDPETRVPVALGATGEIVIRGPQVFDGYWGLPEATREAFIEIDGRRYFRTGDLGYIDEDGYFFMIDRLKRIINVAGYKVSPAEVETALFDHPSVKEACVVAANDARRGEMVKAFIVLRPGARANAGEIIEWANGRIAPYKVPRLVEFVDSLPRSGSGKVQWRLLQAQPERAGQRP